MVQILSLFKNLIFCSHGFFALTFVFKNIAIKDWIEILFILITKFFGTRLNFAPEARAPLPSPYYWPWWWRRGGGVIRKRPTGDLRGGSNMLFLDLHLVIRGACFIIIHYTLHVYFIHFSDACCILQWLGKLHFFAFQWDWTCFISLLAFYLSSFVIYFS